MTDHLSELEARARWERGYRCHGLWSGRQRIAYVSLPPHFARPMTYIWHLDADVQTAGETRTLRTAKRQAERALAALNPQATAEGMGGGTT